MVFNQLACLSIIFALTDDFAQNKDKEDLCSYFTLDSTIDRFPHSLIYIYGYA